MSKGMWVLIAIDVVLLVYIWRHVKRGDEEMEAVLDFRAALEAEAELFNREHRRVIPLPPADVDAPYEAYMLDGTDHPHPRDAA